MTSSRWEAQGNVYLVTTERLAPELVRAEVGDADGILEVFRSGDDWLEIAIWNPDGSRAEMSGNGTRIAATWLADETGARTVTVRVGPRVVVASLRDDGLVEQDMGEIEVGEPETIDGITFRAVDVGNPHAVVDGDPVAIGRVGPFLEVHERFPQRTNVQIGRRVSDGEIEARVWERGAGETKASGSSAVAVAAAFGCGAVRILFPGGPLDVRFEGRRAFLTGPANRVD